MYDTSITMKVIYLKKMLFLFFFFKQETAYEVRLSIVGSEMCIRARALMECLNDVGAVQFLGVQTLTLSVYSTWTNRGDLAGAAQIACVMLVVVLFLVWLAPRGRRSKRFLHLFLIRI